MESKKQRLKELDHYTICADEARQPMDKEDFKDLIYARWLYRATRYL